NYGAAKTKYSNLLFLDADVVLPKSFLETLQRNFKPKRQYVATVLHVPTEKHIMSFIVVLLLYPFLLLARFYSPWVPGTCVITSRDNHKKINGFAEGSIFGEDIDYGKRSVTNGAQY